jgi:hypothetical protein
MKEVTAWYCQVDCYRNGYVFRDEKNRLYDRQTKGDYVVGAKTADEARKILQKAIGFGSITIPKYQGTQEWIRKLYPNMTYKQIIRRHPSDMPVKHATDTFEQERNE